jgi:hypothetical protein
MQNHHLALRRLLLLGRGISAVRSIGSTLSAGLAVLGADRGRTNSDLSQPTILRIIVFRWPFALERRATTAPRAYGPQLVAFLLSLAACCDVISYASDWNT